MKPIARNRQGGWVVAGAVASGVMLGWISSAVFAYEEKGRPPFKPERPMPPVQKSDEIRRWEQAEEKRAERAKVALEFKNKKKDLLKKFHEDKAALRKSFHMAAISLEEFLLRKDQLRKKYLSDKEALRKRYDLAKDQWKAEREEDRKELDADEMRDEQEIGMPVIPAHE